MQSSRIFAGFGAVVLASLAIAACSSATNHSGFADTTSDGGSNTTSAEGGSSTGFGTNGAEAGGPCQGIGCNAVLCQNGTPTTITGQVFDPAGKNPLYNVIVYIPTDPNAPLPPLSQGVSCDKCGAVALNPVVSALTDENGKFTLSNVPVMKGVPIVVQVGKWRKKIMFDVNTKCAENKLDAPITLPKNGTEGDMPQIAIAQGGLDALECLVRGIGVDVSEFEPGIIGKGHVHLYKGYGGNGFKGLGAPDVSALWEKAEYLSAFDIVGLSCEGQEYMANKSANALQAMHDYAEAGGRIFATHYHYVWFEKNPQQDWKNVATWGGSAVNENNYPVDTSFPKGKSFAKWLSNVGAASSSGLVDLNSSDVTDSISSVSSSSSQAWITGSSGTSPNPSDVKYFSFNTPTTAAPAAQCGRVVFGDIHVSGSGAGSAPFPDSCPPMDLTAQQKALEFLFFDLSSCVQSDATQPQAPK